MKTSKNKKPRVSPVAPKVVVKAPGVTETVEDKIKKAAKIVTPDTKPPKDDFVGNAVSRLRTNPKV